VRAERVRELSEKRRIPCCLLSCPRAPMQLSYANSSALSPTHYRLVQALESATSPAVRSLCVWLDPRR
jgi:hypothetical protein